MDSMSEYVRLSLLKVLTVMVETGAAGLKTVLNALDVVKVRHYTADVTRRKRGGEEGGGGGAKPRGGRWLAAMVLFLERLSIGCFITF